MASADLRDELTCSICLNIYTDPVTLSCGHSFCRVCITKAWDKGEKKEYVCAKCNQRFKKRPRLHRNLKLSKIAERFQSPHQDQKDIGIPCTYCIHAPVPAVKSCLLCEASLCEKHLNIHSKSVEHILMEPITSFENRKCSVHKEILKYYCSKDDVCICVSCRLDGEHKGHQVESLEQASEKKKKLRNILEKLTSERKKAEKRVQSLMVRKEEVHKETDVIKELLNNMILDLKERLENLEKEVLSEISKKEKQLNLQISEQIQKLEIEKEELSKKMSHIEGLCNVTDPVTVLREQESNSKYGCDAKKGNDQGSEKDYLKVLGLENPDLQLYSSKIFTGLNSIQLAIERWDEVRQASDYYRKENMYSGKLLKADTELDSIKDIQITDDILLDINTASNEILVSSDLRTVMNSNKHQGRTETPKRFQNYCPQVFSIKSFSSGQHYWEVETAKLAHIRVGVAYPSIDRKGHDSMIGTNTKSWCVERVDVQYKALNNNRGILLPHCASGNVIGIYLDYDAGRLSFYERSNSVKHLHTFTVTFKEPLHLLFWVLDEFIKIRALKH